MAIGRIKWYDPEKGYGFIVPDVAGPDMFVHATSLEEGKSLTQGDRVSYEIGNNKGRDCAITVERLI